MACLVHEHEGKILYLKPTRDFYLTPTLNLARFLMQLKLFFEAGGLQLCITNYHYSQKYNTIPVQREYMHVHSPHLQ